MVVGLILAMAGCVTDEAVDDTDLDGDGKADGANSPVSLIQTNSPFYWAPSDYPSFIASVTSLGSPVRPVPIEDDEALARRLQAWVDRLDAIVRRDVERSMGDELVAPKPIVKVLPSSRTFNAWVSGTVACTGATIASGVPNGNEQTIIRSTQVFHGQETTCVRPTYPDMAEFRTFWGRHKPACKVDDAMSVGGTGCEVVADGAPGDLAIFATSPYIHVTTDLIASVSEQTMVLVLAHELGHYYRSHLSDAKVQRYNFWYETEIDRKKLPVPAASATELQVAYAEIVKGPETVQSATPGRYSPRLRRFLLTDLAPLLTERREPGFVCATARDAIGTWVEPLLAGYGIPTEAMTSYLAFERALAACAPRLDLTSGPSATTLSYGTVLFAAMGAKLPGATYPFRATLADVLTALDGRAVRLDQKAAALLQRVRDNRIGLYTTEQEADNIALALATELGLPADQVIASWLGFMDAVAGVVGPEYRAQYEAQNASCRTLLADSFTTVNGAGQRIAAFVPIGDLSEPHHSACYRLFNFWREQKLRKYQVSTPLVFDSGWDELRANARAISDLAATLGN